MRRTTTERQERKPQEYVHISRLSDEVFRQTDKQNNSRVSWESNIILYTIIPRFAIAYRPNFYPYFFDYPLDISLQTGIIEVKG